MPKGDFSVQVVGFEQFERRLISLGLAAKPILRNALKVGGVIIRDAARANVKDGPGTQHPKGQLRRSIKVRMKSRGGKVTAYVGTGSKDNLFVGKTFYGGFVEYGHKLGSRKLGAARAEVPPHSFMAAAVQQKRQQAGNAILAEIESGLKRAGA